MDSKQIPIFPLYTVLFPGGLLPLKIFEARYLDMISQCLKSNSGFGVSLIREGSEVGKAANVVDVGVIANIVDWQQRQDGLLGITAIGDQRFKINSVAIQENQLLIAEVDVLRKSDIFGVPVKYRILIDVVKRLMVNVDRHHVNMEMNYGDADWLANRLSELLPIELHHKQQLLEIDDVLERLDLLYGMIEGMEVF